MTAFYSACEYPTSVTEKALRRAKQISRVCALDLAAPVANERPMVSVLYTTSQSPGFSGLTGIFFNTALQLARPFVTGFGGFQERLVPA